MNPPLEGVRVVDFGQFIAAPAATQILVDLGADVIKVEPVHGESARLIGLYGEAILRTYNRDKRCIALDLKNPHGQKIARQLIDSADIVVQNLRPGVMESFGLGAAAVRARAPAARLRDRQWIRFARPRRRAGPASTSPRRPRAGSCGSPARPTVSRNGSDSRWSTPPLRTVLAQAILGAYVRRLRFGAGDEVEVSLLEVAIHLQGPNWGEYLLTGNPPVRSGNGQPTVAPAADIMPTRDGAIVVSAYSVPHFEKLCRLIQRPDLVLDERFGSNAVRVANRAELLVELRSAFAHMSTEQAMDLLTPNGVVAGRISSYDEVRKNPDVEATGLFIDVEGPDGTQHTTLGSPWHLASVTGGDRRGAPGIGQHTAELLGELGYTGQDISTLAARSVIGLPQ